MPYLVTFLVTKWDAFVVQELNSSVMPPFYNFFLQALSHIQMYQDMGQGSILGLNIGLIEVKEGAKCVPNLDKNFFRPILKWETR